MDIEKVGDFHVQVRLSHEDLKDLIDTLGPVRKKDSTYHVYFMLKDFADEWVGETK